jgi:hypothetical protein
MISQLKKIGGKEWYARIFGLAEIEPHQNNGSHERY